MARKIRSRESVALAISLIALFVALGGPSYARKIVSSIDGHSITKGTIEADRLSKNARKALTGKSGRQGAPGRQGSQGPQGQQGQQGVPGTAVAWARFRMSDGGLVAGKNITQDQVTPDTSNPGVVCFHDLNFTVQGMIATSEPLDGYAGDTQVFVNVGPRSTATGCPASSGGFNNEAFVSAWEAADFQDQNKPRAFPSYIDVWFQ